MSEQSYLVASLDNLAAGLRGLGEDDDADLCDEIAAGVKKLETDLAKQREASTQFDLLGHAIAAIELLLDPRSRGGAPAITNAEAVLARARGGSGQAPCRSHSC